MIYDLIIIGGGPAGITAGIYAAREKIKNIINHQGMGRSGNQSHGNSELARNQKISGTDLIKQMSEHLKEFEIEIKQGKEVIDLDKKGDIFTVRDNDQAYEAKTVIIATGKIPRTLNIPGEEEFKGRGVSFCATCDAPMFKDKAVAVVGGGNAGFMTAMDLIKYAKRFIFWNFFRR